MSKRGTKKGHKRGSSHRSGGTAGRYNVRLGGNLDLGGLGGLSSQIGHLASAQFRPMQEMQNSAQRNVEIAFNKKYALDEEGMKAEYHKSQRAMREKMADMQAEADEQQAKAKKAMAKKAAENAERNAKQRIEMDKGMRKVQRDMRKKQEEQRDGLEAQQLDMAKKGAEQQLKMAQDWANSSAAMGAAAFTFNFPSTPDPAAGLGHIPAPFRGRVTPAGTILDPLGRPTH